jgi:ketosteroid isomerase-like protein
MRLFVAAAGLALTLTGAAHADPAAEARALYDRFVMAENASDFDAVRSVLLDSPRFLWVTNGLSIWGSGEAIRRMADYHTAEIWHILREAARAIAVTVNAETSFLHVPLELAIGPKADGADHFHFLVSALCVATPQGWRIAALFTTMENRE